MTTLQERREAMDKLRENIKKSRYTYRCIGGMVGNSANWVGQCLRGNYPYRGGYHLPHKIADYLARIGFADAVFLKINYMPRQVSPSDRRPTQGYPDQDIIDEAFKKMPKLPMSKVGGD